MNFNNLLAAVFALVLGIAIGHYVFNKNAEPSMAMMTELSAAIDLKMALRQLWSDHVVWTRQFIVAALNDSPDASVAVDRLMKNQEEIGAVVAQFYGDEAGIKLTALLKDHIKIAGDLVGALKANEQEKAKTLDEQWHANAQEIATFLSSANPNWPLDAFIEMLNEHLSLTAQEVNARINKNWQEDVVIFDKVQDQAGMMADALADGIVLQFSQTE